MAVMLCTVLRPRATVMAIKRQRSLERPPDMYDTGYLTEAQQLTLPVTMRKCYLLAILVTPLKRPKTII